MRFLVLIAGLALAARSASAADSPDLTPLKHWLAHQGEVRSVQADFIQTRSFHALRDPLASPGHLWFEVPQSFRWELGDPAKTVVLRRGDAVYLIQPPKRRAEHLATADLGKAGASSPLPMMNFPLAKSFDDFNRQFEVTALSVVGSRCHVELRSRDPQEAKYLASLALDFDTENGFLLDFEARTRDGSSLRNEFTNVRLNAKIDPHVFDFDLAGYEVADAKK